MNPLLLAFIIESMAVEHKFERTNWPLHITLVPWFTADHYDYFQQAFSDAIAGFRPFKVTVGKSEKFGIKKNIPVSLIEPCRHLQELHQSLLKVVKAEGKIKNSRYTDRKYRPHITHHAGKPIPAGKEVLVDKVHIVELINPSSCKVAAEYGV